MSTFQRVIKAMAIALAVFIIFSIASAIISAIAGLAGIEWLCDTVSDEKRIASTENTFNIDEVKNLELISGIDEIEILQGENEFKVIGENVLESYTCELDNETLVVKSSSKNNIKLNFKGDSKITIYIPQDFAFDNVSFQLGAGETRVKNIKTQTLDMKCGAGEVELQNIEANKNAKISCGVGEFSILNSNMNNLDLSTGVGECSINSELTGECKIEAGVGEINIKLINFNENDSRLKIEKGIGEITINDKHYSNQELGNGDKNSISVEGGIGEIDIDY